MQCWIKYQHLTLLYMFLVGILCFKQELRWVESSTFHSSCQCLSTSHVLFTGFFCFHASRNAPRCWDGDPVYWCYCTYSATMLNYFAMRIKSLTTQTLTATGSVKLINGVYSRKAKLCSTSLLFFLYNISQKLPLMPHIHRDEDDSANDWQA